MTYNLISEEDYKTLIRIQSERPLLTFQNNGYEYIDKKKFDQKDQFDFDTVTDILRKSITGFSKFNNFLYSKKGELQIRFQYHYDADLKTQSTPFTGVGYLLVKELISGF